MKRSKIYKIFYFTQLLWLTSIFSYAQKDTDNIVPHQYQAIHWTMEDGLSSNSMNVMIKDVKGFLWIGSAYGGFCKFDGATFKKYLPDIHNQRALYSDAVFSLVEDSLHNIWIGTAKGLSRYDIKSDTFSNFFSEVNSANPNHSIVPFWATQTQVYCIESELTITTYDIHSLEKKIILSLSTKDKITSMGIKMNSTILDTATNSLWMLGLDEEIPNQTALFQINLDQSKNKKFVWPSYTHQKKHPHTAEAMCLDYKRNSIWINSSEGLIEFSLNNYQFAPVKAFDAGGPFSNYERFVGIDLDLYGRVWIASKSHGILIYDPASSRTTPLFTDQRLQQKPGDSNLQLYCDPDGIVWTSNWWNFGIYEILPVKPSVIRYTADPKNPTSLSNASIHSIVPAANELWIGTEDGLNIFDTRTEKFKVLRKNDLPGISGNFIVPVHVDNTLQKAWIRTAANILQWPSMDLYVMDLQTRQCRPIIFRDGEKEIKNTSIPPAWFWPYQNGLITFDERHGLFEIRPNSLYADLLIPIQATASRMVLVNEEYIFLNGNPGGANFTFKKSNGVWSGLPHPMDSMDWFSMYYHKKDNTYWVSLKYELLHLDKAFKKIRNFSQDHGFNCAAHNIMMDDENNLWFTNDLDQISRLNTNTGHITALSESDGYQKQKLEWFGPIIKDNQGNINIGTTNGGTPLGGLDRIFSNKYASADPSRVYLRSLSINSIPYHSTIGINQVEELSLPHDQNTIHIETGIIDFYSKGKSQIRYKLIGENKDTLWQYGPAYYSIRYEDLSPGSYKLILQASNVNSEFNSIEKIIQIHIAIPFWETWWFRTLTGLTFILIVYSFIQYRSRSLHQQNKVLEEKVVVRTNELKQSLQDLKETQSQLIQKEKMASLGELTAGIAHEIQNPLNFVNNFSEVNAELISEMKHEMSNGNIEEAKLIAQDIDGNGQKIIHHGKRAEAIVKGMLLHSGTSTRHKVPSDLNSIAEESLKLSYQAFLSGLTGKGFDATHTTFHPGIQTELDPSVISIKVIPQDFGRALLNIFNNAFYACAERLALSQAEVSRSAVNEKQKSNTENYEPLVSLSTKKIYNASKGNWIEIKIRDNGIGISLKNIDKIYQPFFTTKPTGAGTGLGLSLAYDIITRVHGGELMVESEENQGTTFTISIPAD